MKWLGSFLLGLVLLGTAQAQNLFLANDGTFKAPVSGGVTITGPAAAGNVPVATSSTAASWQNLYGIPATWTAVQTHSATDVFNGGISGTLVSGLGQALNFNQTLTGSASANTNYNSIVLSDTATITGGFFGNGFSITNNFGGSLVQGGRQVLTGTAALTSPTAAGNTNRNYVGVTGVGIATANDNGTSPSLGMAAGGMFGGNFVGALNNSAATSFLGVSGAEFNTRIVTGASAAIKTAAQFTSDSLDRVSGLVIDSMLWFSNQSASNPGWNNWAFIDASAGAFPIKNTGTLFATGSSGTVANGFDLSNTIITGNAWKSNGFIVNGSGAISSGFPGVANGSLALFGTTSGNVTQTVPAAAGTPTVIWGSNSGTPAVAASAPLAITASTGNITCATCATTTNGGALSATAPIAISAGGVISFDNTAWTAFTLTPTCGTATFTSNSARSKTYGKTTWVAVDFTFTAVGTCTSTGITAPILTFSLPNTSNSASALSGQEIANTAKGVACSIASGSTTTLQCKKADGTAFATNDRLLMSGVYENQ